MTEYAKELQKEDFLETCGWLHFLSGFFKWAQLDVKAEMLAFKIYILHVSQQVAGISWMPCGMLRLFCWFVFVFLDSCFGCDAAAWTGYCCYKVKEAQRVQSLENEKWLWGLTIRRVLVQLHWHLRYLRLGQGISVFQFWIFLYVFLCVPFCV